MNKKKLAIYIHIPFCVKKCLYCDFLSDKADADTKKEYIDSLIKEIEHYALDDSDIGSKFSVATIFFGGGTPSIVEPAVIADILDAVSQRFELDDELEISIECNPGTATKEKMIAWKKIGVNRISIGLQSACDEELKHLGRIHNYCEFVDTYRWAREAGFDNINIDIMSAIPGQTLESYKATLDKVVELNPEHISSYSLIVEEETPFYDIYGDDTVAKGVGEYSQWPDLPDEDSEREMYYLTDQILSEHGYHKYEISNYSRDGYECKHNKCYWDGTDYIGFGLGASSYIKGIRYSNTSDFYKYVNACRVKGNAQNQPYYVGAGDYTGDDELFEEEIEEAVSLSAEEFGKMLLAEKYHEAVQLVSKNEQMEEFMYLGLRMMRGVSKKEFAGRFHVTMNDVYGKALEKLKSEGMLIVEDDNVRLTPIGIDVSNRVLANFLL